MSCCTSSDLRRGIGLGRDAAVVARSNPKLTGCAGLRGSRSCQCVRVIRLDHVGRLFGDHHHGALVLPDTSVGMIEQSITRSSATTTAHPQAGVDHAHRIIRRGHLAGAARVEDGAPYCRAKASTSSSLSALSPGGNLANQRLQRLRAGQACARSERRDGAADVSVVRQIV